MSLRLLVDLPLELFEEERLDQVDDTIHGSSTASILVTASSWTLSIVPDSESNDGDNKNKNNNQNQFAAFFLSPAVTESVVQDIKRSNNKNNNTSSNSNNTSSSSSSSNSNKNNNNTSRCTDPVFILNDEDVTHQLSRRLLTMVHPFLAENFAIRGILSLSENARHRPADIVLLDLSHIPDNTIVDQMLQITNGQTIHSGPEAILKIIVVSKASFQWAGDPFISPKVAAAGAVQAVVYDLPSCPVCLHRINPTRLSERLPSPQNHQLCSKFCPPPNLTLTATSTTTAEQITCPRQRLLRPWPSPCRCNSCTIIDKYWKAQILRAHDDLDATATNNHGTVDDDDDDDDIIPPGAKGHLRCSQCGLKETLWVCLTCGAVGCGRYSGRHSVEHFDETAHPFSLELATLRIWDYVRGDFSHRTDFLDCPSSPPLLYPWIQRRIIQQNNNNGSGGGMAAAGYGYGTRGGGNGCGSAAVDEMKSPKKAFMIGEEYEALLQSALEDQAQHYEGEITSLRARLTEDNFHPNESTLTQSELHEIEMVRAEIDSLRSEIDRISRELVEFQAKDAGYRATSQDLLRQQQVAQDLLRTIKEETQKEHQQGRLLMEELEQQIADLTANQQMRHTFSQDEELQQAQIWGMSSDSSSAARQHNTTTKKGTGKKTRRGFRK